MEHITIVPFFVVAQIPYIAEIFLYFYTAIRA